MAISTNTVNTCPKCGATVKTHADGLVLFDCWSYKQKEDINIRESSDCFRRQLAQRDSVIAEMGAMIAALDPAAKIGKRWLRNSSLDKWFPFSHEELGRLRFRVRELEEAGDLMCKYYLVYGPESVMAKEAWLKAKGQQ